MGNGIIKRTISKMLKRGLDSYFTEYSSDMGGFMGGLYRMSQAGVKVTEENAMRVATVYACVRGLSEDLASLPLDVFKRTDKGKEKDRSHSLYPVLHNKVNSIMTSFSFRESSMWHLLLYGNCYAYKTKTTAGKLIGLTFIDSRRMAIRIIDGKLKYIYDNGTSKKVYNQDEILHIVGPSKNGIEGSSVIAAARDAIGLSIATERFGSNFFANGAHLSGLLTHPGKRDMKAEKIILDSWKDKYGGNNQNSVGMLWNGMEYTAISVPPDDAQFLETREYQAEDICSMFRYPQHMAGILKNATFSNIEHQGIGYVVYTLRPWIVRWEQGINSSLFTEQEQHTHFAEFNIDGLLRGDTKARNAAYKIMHSSGAINVNEWRAMENMNPIVDKKGNLDPAGDKYMMQNVWTPLGQESPAPVVTDNNRSEIQLLQSLISRNKPIENRGKTNIKTVRKQYYGLFEDAAKRFVGREIKDVTKAVNKYLGERSQANLKAWLKKYYNEHSKYVTTVMKPVYKAYAEAVYGVAAGMLDDPIPMGKDVAEFSERYMGSFVNNHTEFSLNQLLKIITEVDDDKMAAAIMKRLEGWEDTRADKIASDETVKASGGVMRYVFGASGIIKLVWVASGGDPCPLCSEMDGRVVGIEQNFVNAGDKVKGGDTSITASSNVMNPPLHQGCECTIVPG